jgi:hypothetical protein
VVKACHTHTKIDGQVGNEIERVRRFPIIRWIVRFDLNENQILLAMKMRGHFHQRFPIDALVINSKTAPFRVVREDLKQQLIDPGTGFAGTRIARTEPTPTEIFAARP